MRVIAPRVIPQEGYTVTNAQARARKACEFSRPKAKESLSLGSAAVPIVTVPPKRFVRSYVSATYTSHVQNRSRAWLDFAIQTARRLRNIAKKRVQTL